MWLDESQFNQLNIFLPNIKLIEQSSMQCREIQLKMVFLFVVN